MSARSFKLTFARSLTLGVLAFAIASPAMAEKNIGTGQTNAWSRCKLDCQNKYPDNPNLQRACIAQCDQGTTSLSGVGGATYTVLAPPPPAPKPPKALDFKGVAVGAATTTVRR